MHTDPSEVAAIDPQTDPDVDVRRGAARNPSCPAEALAALAGVRLSEATTDDRAAGAPTNTRPEEV